MKDDQLPNLEPVTRQKREYARERMCERKRVCDQKSEGSKEEGQGEGQEEIDRKKQSKVTEQGSRGQLAGS